MAGKPLIVWTIDAARSSRYVDRVVVSTDDEEIASVARTFRADVPFLRPGELATDESRPMDALLHAVTALEAAGDRYDFVMLLQPTSPLRTARDIDSAAELLFSINAGAVVSVCEAEHHPYWSNTLQPDGNMKDFLRPEISNSNRQELPIFYRLNGALYMASSDYLKAKRSFMNDDTYAYIMPRERSVDIDTAFDFAFAELLLTKIAQSNV